MKRDTHDPTKNVDDVIPEAAASSARPAKRTTRKPGLRKAVPPTEAGPIYYKTAEAARILRLTDEALRKRLDRAERKADGTIEFELGENVVIACKFGSQWRYQIKPR